MAERTIPRLHSFRSDSRAAGRNVLHAWVALDVDDHWQADLRLALQDGRLVVSEVRVFPARDPRLPRGVRVADRDVRDPGTPWPHGEAWGLHARVPGAGLTSRLLRRVPVQAYERITLATPEGSLRDLPDDGELLLRSVRPRQPSTGPRRGRPPIATEALLAVAAIYAKALATGHAPVRAIIKAKRLTPARARDLVHRARQRRLLTKTSQGRPGGQLTDLARALLTKQKRARRRRRPR